MRLARRENVYFWVEDYLNKNNGQKLVIVVKKRRRSKSKSRKPWLIVVGIALIVALVLVTYQPEGQTPKIPASEYFSFSDAAAHANYHRDDVIRIDIIQFFLTPVGGDAHNVIIFFEGNYNPLDWYYPEILNGTKTNFETQLPVPIELRDSDDGKIDNVYPMEIRVYSSEAEGYVTVNVVDPIFGPLPG